MLRDSLGKENEEDKKVRYAILKVFGIVALGVAAIGALGAGVGLALGAFGISTGIPLVGSALVTAGSWLATAIPALGVALPIALGAIGGLGIAALAIFGIYKFVKSLSISPQPGPKIKKIKYKLMDNTNKQTQMFGPTPIYTPAYTQTNAQTNKQMNEFGGLGEDEINSNLEGNQPPITSTPMPLMPNLKGTSQQKGIVTEKITLSSYEQPLQPKQGGSNTQTKDDLV